MRVGWVCKDEVTLMRGPSLLAGEAPAEFQRSGRLKTDRFWQCQVQEECQAPGKYQVPAKCQAPAEYQIPLECQAPAEYQVPAECRAVKRHVPLWQVAGECHSPAERTGHAPAAVTASVGRQAITWMHHVKRNSF